MKKVIYTTIGELEAHWGHSRDEWGLLGPSDAEDEEIVRFQYDPEEEKYQLERYYGESDIWDVSLDEFFNLSDVPGILTKEGHTMEEHFEMHPEDEED